MKNFICLLALLTLPANAAVERRDRNMKLPSQEVIEVDSYSAPVAADADRILDDQATSSSTTTAVTSFLAQPDVCRAVSITPGGSTGDVPAGNVTVAGLNAKGESMSEAIALSANQSTIASGSQAFCSVSSITFPIQDAPGAATYDVGVLDKLGLEKCMAGDHVLLSDFGGVYETTRPTVAYDVDEVEKNTVDLNSALDGATNVKLYYMQNFRCE